ncbi:MAG: hypothetical protein U5N58_06065 [Actinomycetota bacterium]|nr:hypothetical protein [Actinomycetota bacterium]
MGYLTHPHTSAGRIPTDKGYRFYVDNLVQTKEPVQAASTQWSNLDLGLSEDMELETVLKKSSENLAKIYQLPFHGGCASHQPEQAEAYRAVKAGK